MDRSHRSSHSHLSGNLGYGHDVGLLVAACRKIAGEGLLHIDARRRARDASSARLAHAPPLESDSAKLHDLLLRHEVHLNRGESKNQAGDFSIKNMEQPGAGRRLLCTGFAAKWRPSWKQRNAPRSLGISSNGRS